MRLIRSMLIVWLFLIVISGCTKVSHQTFRGNSENWSGGLIQIGKIKYRDHKELTSHYEIEYESNEALKLYYIGNEENLGQLVEYSYKNSRGVDEDSEGKVIEVNRIFTLGSGRGANSYIPKDMDFTPFYKKDTVIDVTVKWHGKEEIIRLKYAE